MDIALSSTFSLLFFQHTILLPPALPRSWYYRFSTRFFNSIQPRFISSLKWGWHLHSVCLKYHRCWKNSKTGWWVCYMYVHATLHLVKFMPHPSSSCHIPCHTLLSSCHTNQVHCATACSQCPVGSCFFLASMRREFISTWISLQIILSRAVVNLTCSIVI